MSEDRSLLTTRLERTPLSESFESHRAPNSTHRPVRSREQRKPPQTAPLRTEPVAATYVTARGTSRSAAVNHPSRQFAIWWWLPECNPLANYSPARNAPRRGQGRVGRTVGRGATAVGAIARATRLRTSRVSGGRTADLTRLPSSGFRPSLPRTDREFQTVAERRVVRRGEAVVAAPGLNVNHRPGDDQVRCWSSTETARGERIEVQGVES